MKPTAHRGSSLAAGLAMILSGMGSAELVSGQDSDPGGDPIRILRPRLDEPMLGHRRSLRKCRPPLRGFRAPILENAHVPWPFDPPDDAVPRRMRQAADLVALRLARAGLLMTVAEAMELIGPAIFVAAGASEIELLRGIGLPVDLLACFQVANATSTEPHAVVRYISGLLASGQTPAAIRLELEMIPFRFTKSHPGFQVASESGEHDIATLRLQLPAGTYRHGQGDGACVDIARQLIDVLPDASFIISIEEKHLDAFLSLARLWPLKRPSRLTLLAAPMPIAQWAQDNGKPGLVRTAAAATPRIATLVPRYACRGEESTIFVPGETFVIEQLAAAGHTVIQSPLLFQGGNLIPVTDPAGGERILLIGEAEVYRNTALGLTREQVLSAFRTEFAVDRCVVLPAVSFHIDAELCIRAHEGRITAFVNDTTAAVHIILSLGIEALLAHGTLDTRTARAAREHLEAGRRAEFISLLGALVAGQADANRYYPESLARSFGTGPIEVRAANLQRFLLAIDILASRVTGPADMPSDRNTQGFVRALQRQEADRRALHQQIRQLGWKVVAVPGLASTDRGINYVNGIHGRTRYIMPAYGGFYEPLDHAAAVAFRKELGPQVSVVPVLCGASQRSLGGVHCSTSVYPRP